MIWHCQFIPEIMRLYGSLHWKLSLQASVLLVEMYEFQCWYTYNMWLKWKKIVSYLMGNTSASCTSVRVLNSICFQWHLAEEDFRWALHLFWWFASRCNAGKKVIKKHCEIKYTKTESRRCKIIEKKHLLAYLKTKDKAKTHLQTSTVAANIKMPSLCSS